MVSDTEIYTPISPTFGIYDTISNTASDLFGSIFRTAKEVGAKAIEKAGSLLSSTIEHKLSPEEPATINIQQPATAGLSANGILEWLGLKKPQTVVIKESTQGGQIPSVPQTTISIDESSGGLNIIPLMAIAALAFVFLGGDK